MANTPRPNQILSDAQVSAITQRAVELQLAGESGVSGLDFEVTTLQQLTQAAEEVGVSQDLVMRAASEVLSPAPVAASAPDKLRNGNLVVDEIFEGRLQPDDVPELLAEVRRLMGAAGEWRFANGEFHWFHSGEGKLTLTPVGRNTRVSMTLPVGGFQAIFVGYMGLGAAAATTIVAQAAGLEFGQGLLAALFVGGLAALIAMGFTDEPFRLAARRRLDRGHALLGAVKATLRTDE